jgi:thiol-disulfide isomerase/thioredoxin
MPIPWTLPPEPVAWWEEPAPCPAGAALQASERGSWCWREGMVGRVSRRDAQGRVLEEWSYDEVAERHGRWVRWTRGPGDSVLSWSVSLYDHGNLLPWAHTSDAELVSQPFPELALLSEASEPVAVPRQGLALVELWTTTCGPCLAAMPHLAAVGAEHQVPALAVSADASEAQWRAGLRRKELPVPTAWGGPSILEPLRTHSLGTTWVLQDGQVVGAVEGWAGPQDVRLEVLLAALQRGVAPGALVAGP